MVLCVDGWNLVCALSLLAKLNPPPLPLDPQPSCLGLPISRAGAGLAPRGVCSVLSRPKDGPAQGPCSDSRCAQRGFHLS